MTTDIDNLNRALTKFSDHFSEMCEQKLFNDMLVTITSVSYKAQESQNGQPLDAESYEECIREILRTVKSAKRDFGNQLSVFHKVISSLVITLDSTSEPADNINKKLKALSSWLVNFKVEVEHKRTSDSLIDFYNELEDFRDNFRDLSKVADDLKERNKDLRSETSALKKEVANLKKNEQKLKKRNEKMLKEYTDLKGKYNDLYTQFCNLLNRKNPQPAATEVTYIRDKEPNANKDINGVWFDIEKSQERYESLLDSYMRVIKEKDQRIKELEEEIQGLRGKNREEGDMADKEKDRMADKIRQLEKENLDLRDACIKLKKNLDQKQDELDNVMADNAELQNFKEQAQGMQSQMQSQKGDLDKGLKELEDKNAELEDKLLKALQRESNYLSGRVDSKDLMEGAKIINEEHFGELERKRGQNEKLKRDNLAMRQKLVDLEDELMNLKKEYDDLNVLAHEKEIDVERLKNELTKARKRDDKSRRAKEGLGKKKAKLQNKLANKEAQVEQLQRQLESQELKLIKMAKLIDRLRFENEKFKNNYRLTQTFSPRKYGEMPPTMRDLSPEPLRIPPGRADPGSRSRSRDRGRSPVDQQQNAKNPENINQRIGTYAFIKSTAADNMSPYMYREENKLVVAGPKKGTKYERSTNGSFLDKRFMPFKGIFTQFELDLMSSEMSGVFNTHKNNIFVIYGTPLNIKLFVMHKAIHVFLSKAQKMIESQAASCLEIVIEDTLADFILSHFKDETATGLCTKSEYKGIFKMVRLQSNIPFLIDSLKKLFFNILSNSSAKIVDFVAVEIVQKKPSSENQKLILIRSSIDRSPPPGRSFKEILNEFMYASRFVNIEDMMNVMRDFMAVETYSKQFFLVLEPGKVNTYEDTYNFLEVHNTVENIRVEQKMNFRNSRPTGVLYN